MEPSLWSRFGSSFDYKSHCISSLHWLVLVFFYALFVHWSILPIKIISCLNQRFYLLKRLKNKINQKNLLTVTDSIFISKIRYGIQLYGKIRWSENDELNGLLEEIQKVQNKLARWLNGVSLKDRKRTST